MKPPLAWAASASTTSSGYLQDGMRSLDGAAGSDDDHRTRQPSARGGAARGGGAALAVDVRGPGERAQKYVAGSVSMPLNHLAERARELPRDRPLIVYCAGGYRSSIAASLLQQQGFTKISEMAGGIAAWEAAKLPIEPPAAAEP